MADKKTKEAPKGGYKTITPDKTITPEDLAIGGNMSAPVLDAAISIGIEGFTPEKQKTFCEDIAKVSEGKASPDQQTFSGWKCKNSC